MRDQHKALQSPFLSALRRVPELTWKLKTRLETRVLGALLSHFRQGNVAMFHVGRSGSRVLGDLLGQHPHVFWDFEIYERLLRDRDKHGTVQPTGSLAQAIDYLRARMPRAGRRFYGFELKFFHLKLLNVELSPYVESLRRLRFAHFVILERRNYLRKIVSSVVAHKKSRFHQASYEKPVLTRVTIDVDCLRIDRDQKPLRAYLEDYRASFDALNEILQGSTVLRLTYEDDIFRDPLVAYGRLCEFLGVRQHHATVRYSRSNPFKLADIIVNFEEVERALESSAFEWMLHE